MKNLKRIITVAVLMMSAVAVFAQHTSSYKIINGKVYYNNMILQEADPRTIQDLGYGYARDNDYVWFEGKILPLVDPYTFRLKQMAPPSAQHPSQHPSQHPPQQGSHGVGLGDILSVVLGNGSGHNHGTKPPAHGPGNNHMHQERGYEIVGTKVYYNGAIVSNASAHSFKELGWGYAKDSNRVFYCGKYLTGNPSRFKALTDGYAMDTFDVYYFGKEIEASTSGFKVLSDGYAKDAFNAYYCGKKVVGSSASTFKVTGNGYAKDAWETYYLGKKVR